MLDIEIYLDILEFIDATAGGEGVEVLFRILSGHGEGSELLVNAQIPKGVFSEMPLVKIPGYREGNPGKWYLA